MNKSHGATPEGIETGVYRRILNGKEEYGSRCADITGKTTWAWGFPTLAKARHDYQKRRVKVRTAKLTAGHAHPTHSTIAELRNIYLPSIQGKRETYKDIKTHLDWWATYFHKQAVLTIESVQIEHGMAKLMREKPCTGSTANRYASSLRRLCNKMVKPASWVIDLWRNVEFYPEPKDPLPFMKDEEEDRLLDALGFPDALYVRLDILLGLRRNEFFQLRWEWVWWDREVLKVPSFKRHPAIDLPIPEEGIAILRILWEEVNRPRDGWIFPVRQRTFVGTKGVRAFQPGPSILRHDRHINADNWYRNHYKPAVRAAGLPEWVTFHTLRRTWATRIGAHTPARILQMLGRWKNMKTAERYCQAFASSMREAMEHGTRATEKPVGNLSGRSTNEMGKLSKLIEIQRKKLA